MPERTIPHAFSPLPHSPFLLLDWAEGSQPDPPLRLQCCRFFTIPELTDASACRWLPLFSPRCFSKSCVRLRRGLLMRRPFIFFFTRCTLRNTLRPLPRLFPLCSSNDCVAYIRRCSPHVQRVRRVHRPSWPPPLII